PECHEIPVRPGCPESVSRQSAGSSQLQMRHRADGIKAHNTAMIEDLLKFGRGFRVPVRGHEGLAAHISRVQTAKIKMVEVQAVRRQPMYTLLRLSIALIRRQAWQPLSRIPICRSALWSKWREDSTASKA